MYSTISYLSAAELQPLLNKHATTGNPLSVFFGRSRPRIFDEVPLLAVDFEDQIAIVTLSEEDAPLVFPSDIVTWKGQDAIPAMLAYGHRFEGTVFDLFILGDMAQMQQGKETELSYIVRDIVSGWDNSVLRQTNEHTLKDSEAVSAVFPTLNLTALCLIQVAFYQMRLGLLSSYKEAAGGLEVGTKSGLTLEQKMDENILTQMESAMAMYETSFSGFLVDSEQLNTAIDALEGSQEASKVSIENDIRNLCWPNQAKTPSLFDQP